MEEMYCEAARKLARTDDPQTSKDAAEKVVKSGELNRQEQVVCGAIERYTSHANHNSKYIDFTTKDIARWITDYSYGKAYDICRKRFSGLKRKGKIELVYENDWIFNKRRDGCRVWRLK